MYNLIEHSETYSKTSGSLCQYWKEVLSGNDSGDIVDFRGTEATDSFYFKTNVTDQTAANINNDNITGRAVAEIMVPLKCLSNFWRTLKMPLMNCEVELILTWSASCAIIYTRVDIEVPTFTITETNL